jgi:hypothetical protein
MHVRGMLLYNFCDLKFVPILADTTPTGMRKNLPYFVTNTHRFLECTELGIGNKRPCFALQ